MNKTSISTLLLASLLCLFQLGLLSACGGCTVQHEEQGTSARESVTNPFLDGVEVLPREAALSRSAETTAAYLTLLGALNDGDEETALQAAETLTGGTGDQALPVEHWLECALWFMDRKSVNAIPFLRTACRALPDDAPLLLLYSEALTDHNFAAEALSSLDAYLARHPGTVDVLLQKGITLQKDGRPAEALQVFESISEQDRTSFLDLYHAQALLALGREKEA
ncbi:MAG: hypothetical protein Q4F72_06110, partial [Desulfovibrionaceae bacterium]|nr:hypothetical protein [Desulfovibrionaceae bacterium]